MNLPAAGRMEQVPYPVNLKFIFYEI